MFLLHFSFFMILNCLPKFLYKNYVNIAKYDSASINVRNVFYSKLTEGPPGPLTIHTYETFK